MGDRQSPAKYLHTYDKYEKDDGYDIWRIYIAKREESGPLLVHCNWGAGGSSDGWYTSGSFYKYNSFDYRNNLEMTNIQPKN
ncbi:MAG: C10 family peptidase [Parabacteroides sp.]|nr:C10 family peptidase [Parabacteroides sp.]